jgi:parallel beta-helix repeat protein
VISLASALPVIAVPAIINGYTQTGSAQNDLDVGDDATICVILENGGSATIGLQVASNAGDGVSVIVDGLAFSGFTDAGIDLQGGSGHSIAGNHFGGSVGGHALLANGVDIRLGTAEHASNIGSDDVADRNIIGDAVSDGIWLQGTASPPLIFGAYNNQIVNNYIGVGWAIAGSNYTNRANGSNGVRLDGHDNTLRGNLIGHNTNDGVLLNGDAAIDDAVKDNFIGVDAGGTNLGNGSMGVRTQNDAHDNNIVANTIANNGQKGVRIVTGAHNKIRKNSIYGNALLGIDIAAEGVTANDDDGGIQPSDYANRGQNFPVLTGAAGGYASGYVTGALTTTAGDYTVDFYLSSACNPAGNGDGQTWLGAATVSVPTPQIGDQGTVDFVLRIREPSIVQPLLNGGVVTATATDAAGDTSEFSACVNYVNDTIFVNGFEPPPV